MSDEHQTVTTMRDAELTDIDDVDPVARGPQRSDGRVRRAHAPPPELSAPVADRPRSKHARGPGVADETTDMRASPCARTSRRVTSIDGMPSLFLSQAEVDALVAYLLAE